MFPPPPVVFIMCLLLIIIYDMIKTTFLGGLMPPPFLLPCFQVHLSAIPLMRLLQGMCNMCPNIPHAPLFLYLRDKKDAGSADAGC